MSIFKLLKHTPIANKRFATYYKSNNWYLTIPVEDFVQLDFRYQCGVLLDYLRKENIEINVCHTGYICYIHSPNDMDENIKKADFLFHLVDKDWYYISVKEIVHPPHIKTKDIMLQEVTKAGIIAMFKLINTAKCGYSISYNSELNSKLK